MKYFKQFLILFLVLVVSPAFAVDPFMVSPTDVSVNELLVKLFEPLVKGNLETSSALGGIIGQFNAIIIMFGGVLLAYTLIAGTMQTAHDGEVLGRKWSSMWLPLRMSIGISALVPLGSGYCVAQYIVMWLVLQGVGAANMIWEAFATNVQPMAQMALVQTNSRANDLAANTLRQSMCVVAINTEIDEAKAMAVAEGRTYHGYENIKIREKSEKVVLAHRRGTSSGDRLNAFQTQNVCGYYALPEASTTPQNGLTQIFGTADKVNAFSETMVKTHIEAYGIIQQKMNDIAVGLHNNTLEEGKGYTLDQASEIYSNAVDEYNKSLNAAIVTATNSMSSENAFSQNATKDGWGLAGAFYLKYIKLQQGLSNEIGKYPTATIPSSPENRVIPSAFMNKTAAYAEKAEAVMKNSTYKDELGIQSMAIMDAMQGDEDQSRYTTYLNRVFQKHKLLETKYWFDIDGQKNVLLSISDAGHRLFNTAIYANLTLAGLVTFSDSKFLGIGIGVNAGINALSTLLMVIFGALFGTSAIMAFLLPLTPFIIWFGVLVGWLVMVVEAIVAAPMWVVTHLYPDADGIVGRAGQGYSLVLALILRPSLAVIGLLFSMAILNPVGLLFVKSYWAVFALSQNGETGLILYIVSLTIFATTLIGLVNRIFTLIHVIPDEIFKWMGGPSGNLGSYGGDLSKVSTGGAAAMGAVAGNVTAKGIEAGQSLRQTMAQKRSGEEEKRQRELAELSTMKKSYSEGKSESDPSKVKAPEEDGVNAANKEVNGMENKDFESAISSLKNGKDSQSKQYQAAMKNGSHEEAGEMIKSKMASSAGFSDYAGYKQNLDDKKEGAYQSWAKTQPTGTVVGSYGLAQQKIAAFDRASETGDWGSISGLSSQSAPKPPSSGDDSKTT